MSSSAYQIHIGDCLEALRAMPDNSVDSIVTDPPYGLSKEPDMAEVLRHWMAGDDYQHKGGGFMGKTWDSFVPGPSIWRECLRVLKPGGHLLAFFGSRTYDMGALAIRLAGFEIRDMGGWLYGSGFPKSHNLEGEWSGWGSALKPAHEPIAFARKPFKVTLAQNVLEHGTGALNIDGCRVELNGDYKCKANGRPSQTGLCDNYDPAKANQPDTVGRWPANLIHDGSEEVLALFPVNAGAAAPVKGTEESAASVGNVTGKRDRVPGAFHADSGSAARFFKQIEVTDEEWLENLSPALIAGSTLSLSKLADAIAQSDAAISALPGGRQLNVLKAPSTSVTPSESKLIATSVITAIQSIASASLLAQQPERLSLSHSHVSVVAHQTPTGTTTITASLSSSAGCAESITFSITPKSLAVGEKACEQSSDRFMYCAKASRKDRHEGLEDPGAQFKRGTTLRQVENTATAGNNHPTVKPTDLMAYLCRLVTPPGGLVLDPFMGSGSTGKAAMREGFRFIGCELSEEYAAIAKARIEHALLASMLKEDPANENAPRQIDMAEVWESAQ